MINLKPFYVTGVVEADGCFQVGFEKEQSRPLGIRLFVQFSFTQSSENSELVKAFQLFFGVGSIKTRQNRFDYIVSSYTFLTKKIFPHFYQYPLIGQKIESFIILQMIVYKFVASKTREHPTESYLWAVAGVYKINPENRKMPKEHYVNLIKSFSKKKGLDLDFVAIENEFNLLFQKKVKNYQNLTLISNPLNTDYILGLTQGDGCFSPQTKVEESANFVFDIAFLTHDGNLKLMTMLENFFNIKGTYDSSLEKCSHFKTLSLKVLRESIIPFFSEHPLGFRKGQQFENFKENFIRIKGL